MEISGFLKSFMAIVTCGMIAVSYSFPSGMVAYYPLNGDGNDISGNGNNGTVIGATAVQGQNGSALYFNGSSTYVSIPDDNIFSFPSGFSISAWIRPETGNNWYRIIAKEATTATTTVSNEWQFGMAKAGGLYFGICKDVNQSYINGATPLSLNTWSHVVGTWDGTTMRTFVNGLQQTETAQVTPPINRATNPLLIGKGAGNTYYFKGAIDELMIFDKALTISEIDSLYSGRYYSGMPILIPCAPNPTYNRQPRLQWYADTAIRIFRIQVASNQTFASPVVLDSTADTSYISTVNLPLGTNYWRVCSNSDTTLWSIPSSFIVLDSFEITVPDQVPTVALALQYGKNIFITANLTENIVIADNTVSISGADSSTTITGKIKITNSSVALNTIKFAGTNGISSNRIFECYFSWMSTLPPCPSPVPGGDGDSAFIVTNSTITIINSSILGGTGGTSGNAFICNCDNGTFCTMPCSLGTRGKNGVAIKASQNTLIDTEHVILGTVFLDGTSRIIPRSTPTIPQSSVLKKIANRQVQIMQSGNISIKSENMVSIAIYTLSGKMAYHKSVAGPRMLSPDLKQGIYLT